VDEPWFGPPVLLYPARIGEFRATSSLLTGAELEGVGEATDPDVLLARSNCPKFGTGVPEDWEPRKGFCRPLPLAAGAKGVKEAVGATEGTWAGAALPFVPFVCGAGWGAGESDGVALFPNLSVIFGPEASGNLSLIFGPTGSDTTVLALARLFLKTL
jgi:hypothetical protein